MTSEVIARLMSGAVRCTLLHRTQVGERTMQRRHFIQASLETLLTTGAVAGCASTEHETSVGGATAEAAAYRAERRYARTAFGRIAYLDRGRGAAVLFLHGFPLNSFQWRGAIERLSKERRCIAPDFLGLGFTQVATKQSVAPAAQAEMLAALLDRLAIDAVDLIANDSGGAVAQLFVLKYPERVRTLLLTNCDVEPDSPPPALQPVLELARAGTFADQWLAPWLADKTLARSAQGLGGMCYSKPGHPSDAAIDYYLGPLVSSAESKARLHAYAVALDPNPLAGIESTLKLCRVPTRIVWGTADNIFSKDSPDYLDRTFANSRGVRTLKGAKLFWPEEYPEVLAEEARALWSATA
jgi:haloalkane dehalogenase